MNEFKNSQRLSGADALKTSDDDPLKVLECSKDWVNNISFLIMTFVYLIVHIIRMCLKQKYRKQKQKNNSSASSESLTS